MTTPVYVHGATDTGPRRKHNEDAFRIERFGEDDVLIVVCDGMGGHADGEVASAVAADMLVKMLRDVPVEGIGAALVPAFTAAHDAVRAISLDGSPGTTAVVVRMVGHQLWYAWVGDSRLYLVHEGVATLTSQDHTRAQELIDGGAMTAEEAARSPHAHALTRVLGGVSDRAAELGVGGPVALAPGDAVLVCSDGLSKMVADEEMGQLMSGRDYRDATARLVQEALDRGGFDNVTVVVGVTGQHELNGTRVHGRLKTRAATAPELSGPSVIGGSVHAGGRLTRPLLVAAVVMAGVVTLVLFTVLFGLFYLQFRGG